ncbi:MAG TPA: hypothetical protein VEC99_00760, partial [Clostridia bacterium]|nr:hypothetical protein [Clostridia bacterium]
GFQPDPLGVQPSCQRVTKQVDSVGTDCTSSKCPSHGPAHVVRRQGTAVRQVVPDKQCPGTGRWTSLAQILCDRSVYRVGHGHQTLPPLFGLA